MPTTNSNTKNSTFFIYPYFKVIIPRLFWLITICSANNFNLQKYKKIILSAKKWEQVLFPTPIINYPLSIINYRFTTFRMVTPCGTVMRSM